MYVFFGAYYLIGTPLGYFMIFTMDLGTYVNLEYLYF